MKISKVETPFFGKLYDPPLELVCDFYKSIFSFLFPYFALPWKLVPPCFSIWSKVSSLWKMKFRYKISLLYCEYFFSWSFHIEKNTVKIHRKKSFCTTPSSYFYQSYYLAYPPSFYYPSTPIFCWPYFCWTFSYILFFVFFVPRYLVFYYSYFHGSIIFHYRTYPLWITQNESLYR